MSCLSLIIFIGKSLGITDEDLLYFWKSIAYIGRKLRLDFVYSKLRPYAKLCVKFVYSITKRFLVMLIFALIQVLLAQVIASGPLIIGYIFITYVFSRIRVNASVDIDDLPLYDPVVHVEHIAEDVAINRTNIIVPQENSAIYPIQASDEDFIPLSIDFDEGSQLSYAAMYAGDEVSVNRIYSPSMADTTVTVTAVESFDKNDGDGGVVWGDVVHSNNIVDEDDGYALGNQEVNITKEAFDEYDYEDGMADTTVTFTVTAVESVDKNDGDGVVVWGDVVHNNNIVDEDNDYALGNQEVHITEEVFDEYDYEDVRWQ
jgi:hypothetical protein